MKKFITLVVGILLTLTIAGCKDDSATTTASSASTSANLSGTLNIAIFLGGYGQKWANDLARNFEAIHPGVTVNVTADPNLPSEIPAYLQNGTNFDIFFSQGVQWQKLAAQGYLANLDDLYSSQVSKGVTFADSVDQSLLPDAKYNGHYYKVPWTDGIGGLVYNKVMFDKYGWKVPTTYQQLLDLCQQISDAKIPVDPNDTSPDAPTIKPFIWSAENYYWDYLLFNWWGQLAGVDAINNYKQMSSESVFDPSQAPTKQLEEAFGYWVNLVAKHPDWSVDDSVGTQYMAAQMDFLNGYAAMMPNAQWLESEMRADIDPSTMDMVLMPTPILPDAKTDSQGNPIQVNYSVGAGDSILVPASSKNINLAKQFLLFMAQPQNIETFTEDTNGVMLAMKYPAGFTYAGESDFAKSTMSLNSTSEKFDLDSQSPLALQGLVDPQWAPDGLYPYADFFNYYDTSTYLQNPSSVPDKSISTWFNDKYTMVTENWDRWNQQANR